MPGMLKKYSVVKLSTVPTVVDRLLGKRVCRFTLKSIGRPVAAPPGQGALVVGFQAVCQSSLVVMPGSSTPERATAVLVALKA